MMADDPFWCTSLHGMALSCHLEGSLVTLSRSEGSGCMGVEMLRCAQHDSAVLLLRHRHLKAFRLLSPLLAIPATPHHPRPHSI